jgi:hypothetical protein
MDTPFRWMQVVMCTICTKHKTNTYSNNQFNLKIDLIEHIQALKRNNNWNLIKFWTPQDYILILSCAFNIVTYIPCKSNHVNKN